MAMYYLVLCWLTGQWWNCYHQHCVMGRKMKGQIGAALTGTINIHLGGCWTWSGPAPTVDCPWSALQSGFYHWAEGDFQHTGQQVTGYQHWGFHHKYPLFKIIFSLCNQKIFNNMLNHDLNIIFVVGLKAPCPIKQVAGSHICTWMYYKNITGANVLVLLQT